MLHTSYSQEDRQVATIATCGVQTASFGSSLQLSCSLRLAALDRQKLPLLDAQPDFGGRSAQKNFFKV
jgi:hypothetical protein